MDTTNPAYTANTTPPDPPSKAQQTTVQNGRFAWHIQTPICSVAAYLTVANTRLKQRMFPGVPNRRLFALIMTSSLPIYGWDFWYWARAERAVNERAAWERAQSMMRTKAVNPNTPASSDSDMADPWA